MGGGVARGRRDRSRRAFARNALSRSGREPLTVLHVAPHARRAAGETGV